MSCCRSCGRKASSNRNPRSPEKFKSRHPEGPRDLNRTLGNDLLSHRVTPAVPSALEGLTSVFGMGTGVSPPQWSPNNGNYTEPGDETFTSPPCGEVGGEAAGVGRNKLAIWSVVCGLEGS